MSVRERSEDVTDAHYIAMELSGSIHQADAKAGLVAAATAAVIAGVAQQHSAVILALNAGSAMEKTALLLLALLAGALLTAGGSVGATIMPRTPIANPGCRFSFHVLASEAWQFTTADRGQVAREAWAHAGTLARILDAKLTAVKVAISAVGVAFVLFCCWTAVAALA